MSQSKPVSRLGRKYNLKSERITYMPKDFVPFKGTLPSKVDLRPKFGPVYDQGQLGSCTANSLMGVFHFDDSNQGWFGSRLFLYYNERKLDGDISQDAGSTISQGVNALKTYGVCAETSWPYDIAKFAQTPNASCYQTAKGHEVLQATHVQQSQLSLKNCLASGFPISLGVSIYESFESQAVAETGLAPLPSANESCLGGHAIICCGYDDAQVIPNPAGGQWTGAWLMRNSWGTSWGQQGYFYFPYDYLTEQNLCSDLWKVTKVSDTPTPAPHVKPQPTPDVKPAVHHHEKSHREKKKDKDEKKKIKVKVKSVKK